MSDYQAVSNTATIYYVLEFDRIWIPMTEAMYKRYKLANREDGQDE